MVLRDHHLRHKTQGSYDPVPTSQAMTTSLSLLSTRVGPPSPQTSSFPNQPGQSIIQLLPLGLLVLVPCIDRKINLLSACIPGT